MPGEIPIARLPQRISALQAAIRPALDEAGERVAALAGRLARQHAARGPRGLAASIVVRGSAIVATHPAAAALEVGSVRGSPWLAVPLSASAQAVGSPRADGALVGVRGRDGRLYLMDRRTHEMRWRLIDRVRPAVVRPVGRGVDDAAQSAPEILQAAGESAVRAS